MEIMTLEKEVVTQVFISFDELISLLGAAGLFEKVDRSAKIQLVREGGAGRGANDSERFLEVVFIIGSEPVKYDVVPARKGG